MAQKLLDFGRLVDDIRQALDGPAVDQLKALKQAERLVNQIDHEAAPQLAAGVREIERIEAESRAAVDAILAALTKKVEKLHAAAEGAGGDVATGLRAVLETTDTLGRVGTILANLNFLMDSNPQIGVDLLKALVDVPTKLDQALTALTPDEIATLTKRLNRELTRRKNTGE